MNNQTGNPPKSSSTLRPPSSATNNKYGSPATNIGRLGFLFTYFFLYISERNLCISKCLTLISY